MINGQMHEHIAKFMSQHKVPAGLRLFVVRSDGLIVWDAKPDFQTQALGALCSGVWDASKAMALTAGQKSVSGFRLVFDSTDHGVLIIPIEDIGQDIFLAAIYERCLNPALLKRQVHNLGLKLAAHVRSLPRVSTSQKVTKREGYLFNEISDEEMDRLFGI